MYTYTHEDAHPHIFLLMKQHKPSSTSLPTPHMLGTWRMFSDRMVHICTLTLMLV
jgi:hypothetical protein